MTKPTSTSRNQTFRFFAPNAISVLLAGDFTEWRKHSILMRKDKDGIWTTSIQLRPGKHTYRFIVDGEWFDDPECTVRVPNPFGSMDMVREAA
ncbi:MAG TPA: isoamylase early set domain-containing protein [Candidatus Binatia bacterium]|nr:isoamylase early set domain-containing protein [Candidatus Binatia bacterium]